MDHLVAQRMALAKRLLRERRQGLWAVAEAVGYGSDKAFVRAFQRHVGCTPAAWLREVA
jgi:AraC-like DNA-binding protein